MVAMVGEVVDRRETQPTRVTGSPLLRVEGAFGRQLRGVDLEVHAGEIVGLTGLTGAGHDELARAIFGDSPLNGGRIWWEGRLYRPRHPADAFAVGIASVPSDRHREGLIPTRSVADNISLAILPRLARFGWLNRRQRQKEVTELCKVFDVSCANTRQPATTLSGGNQQKVLLARWAATTPRLLILNEPTRGIDVRTREAIHRQIEDLAQHGMGILLITADSQELLRLSDRLLVFRAGHIVREFRADEATENVLLSAMIDDPTDSARRNQTP
jgi:ABC-type sugar transport system ATPase subunit